MNIIIVGCGKIGTELAERLNNESHDITIIDTDEKVVKKLASELDIMGVTGNGNIPSVLETAGIQNADAFIATTGSDEFNMLCCLMAKKAKDLITIARVRNTEYDDEISYLRKELGISMVINPDKLLSHMIVHLLNFPKALETETFSTGRIDMITIKVPEMSPIVNLSLKDFPQKTKSNPLICFIERNDTREIVIPTGDTKILPGDCISVILDSKNTEQFKKEFSFKSVSNKYVVLIGASRLSHYIVRLIRKKKIRCDIKVIDSNLERCRQFAEMYPEVTVINGNALDQKFLESEGVNDADCFMSLTGNDEKNLLLSLFASNLSASQRITKINVLDAHSLKSEVDAGSIVSTKSEISDIIVRYLSSLENASGSNIERLYRVAQGKVEALEFIIQEEKGITGIPLSELELKDNVLIAAIIRGKEQIRPTGTDKLQGGDHVVIITTQHGIRKIRDMIK